MSNTKLKIKPGEWTVVCDGCKALILQNFGNDRFIHFRVVEHHEQTVEANHNIGTDKPGRVHWSLQPHRSTVELPDWHDNAETAFLRRIAERLQAALAAQTVDSLILVAPPRALGALRKLLTPSVRKLVKREIARDFTHLPLDEVERRLANHRIGEHVAAR